MRILKHIDTDKNITPFMLTSRPFFVTKVAWMLGASHKVLHARHYGRILWRTHSAYSTVGGALFDDMGGRVI